MTAPDRSEVLWVTAVPPDHLGGGGHLRQAYLIDALAAEAPVHLLCSAPVTDRSVREAVARVTEVPVRRPERSRTARRARDLVLATGLAGPREVADHRAHRRALAPHVRDLAGRARLVMVEYAGLAGLVSARGGPAPPWVLTLHNLGSEMAAQQAAVVPGRRRWLYSRDAAVAGRWEQVQVGRFDRVLVCSDADATGLGAGSGRRVEVVPNWVDLDRYRPTARPGRARIVFTGALYTGPNRDGAAWFAREVLPAVRSEVPAAELDIVGADPAPDVVELASLPGVTVHPDVADVAPYIEAADVVVVPIRIGSGTRLKALEGLAAGRAVVGTTIGLAGLGLEPGVEVAVADDRATFSASVVRLLRDDAAAAALGRSGRLRVERDYGWEAIGRRFADLVLAT